MFFELSETVIFYLVLGVVVLETLWELYLGIRQHKIYGKYKEIPTQLDGIMDKATFEKARQYSRDRNGFSLFRESHSMVMNTVILLLDGLYIVWCTSGNITSFLGYDPEENEMLQSTIFVVYLNLVTGLMGMPYSVYETFIVEEKHGFNNQTASFYLMDRLKGFVLGQVLSIIMVVGLVYIVRNGGDYFFIYLWLFTTAVSLALLTIYPDFIAPLFDKYTPLPDGELRTEIEKLAQSLSFPLTKIYVVEGSKRSAHSNAYFYGFFKNKRIVLFDTLLKKDRAAEEQVANDNAGAAAPDAAAADKQKPNEDGNAPVAPTGEDADNGKGCDINQVLAVLCHELGHWKYNHVLKNIVIMQVNLFLVFFAFGLLFNYRPLYAAFGFTTMPVMIGFVLVLQLVFTPYFTVLSFLMAILSRRYEFQADKFATDMGKSEDLKKALIKLNSDNLGFPLYDLMYSRWHHSHPPLLQRLQQMEKED